MPHKTGELCPDFLSCPRGAHCLCDPVRCDGQHLCRQCLREAEQPSDADPLVLRALAQWHSIEQGDFYCAVCSSLMVEPVPLACCGHSFCLGCLQKLDDCPLCRTELPSVLQRGNAQLQALMRFCLGSRSIDAAQEEHRREAKAQRLLLDRAQRYLHSERWSFLIKSVKLLCRGQLERQWYVATAELQRELAERCAGTELTSLLSDAEFQLLLKASEHVHMNYMRVGALLLPLDTDYLRTVQRQAGACKLAELHNHVFGAAVSELLQCGVQDEVLHTFLRSNAVSEELIAELDREVDLMDGPLPIARIRQEATAFVQNITEWDLVPAH